MKLEKDHAIIETAEEAFCIAGVTNGIEVDDTSDPDELIEVWVGIGSEWGRKPILEAITPKEGDAVLWVHTDKQWDGTMGDSPMYLHNEKELNRDRTLVFKANAITIGKTCGELRELLTWAKA